MSGNRSLPIHGGRGQNRGRGGEQSSRGRGSERGLGSPRGGARGQSDNRGSGRGSSTGPYRGSDTGGRGQSDYRGSSRGSSSGPYRDSDRGGFRGGGRGGSYGGASTRKEAEEDPKAVGMYNPAQSDKVAEAFEDRCVAKNKGHRAAQGELALRPGYGLRGTNIVVRANFFEAVFHGAQWFSHHAKIEPEADNARARKEVFVEFMGQRPLRDANAATDSAQEVVTTKNMVGKYEVTVDSNLKPKKFLVILTLNANGAQKPGDLVNALDDTSRRVQPTQEDMTLRMMNILMGTHPFQDPGATTIRGAGGNKSFWTDERRRAADLQGGIECIRGFSSSARICDNRIFINLGVNHSSFFHQGPLANIFNLFYQMKGPDLPLLNRYINRLRVDVTHLKKRMVCGVLINRQRSIWGLADSSRDGYDAKLKKRIDNPPRFTNKDKFGATPDEVSFFKCDRNAQGISLTTGKYVTVTQFFKEEHHINLIHRDKPVVNIGSFAHPVYLPLDVCEVPAGQRFMGELAQIQRTNIINFSCRKPPNNYKSITQDGLKIMGMDQLMKGVNVSFKPGMIAVKARILSPPTLQYGNRKTMLPKNGMWNLRDQKFCKGAVVKRCVGIVFSINRDLSNPEFQKAHKAFGDLMAEGKRMGMKWPDQWKEVDRRMIPQDTTAWMNMIEKLFKYLENEKVDLVVIALPGGQERFFDHLKWWSETKTKVMTHCCAYSKFIDWDTSGKQENSQYNANNIMKINLKMGGDNQTLKSAPRLIEAGKTMVVGLDVTHPSPTDPDTFPSLACIVASTDKSMGQWPGEIKIQQRREETMVQLTKMMQDRLHHWKAINQEFPSNILIYRDGVSDGQFQKTVLEKELPQVRAAITNLYKGQTAHITIVVASKRHNVRFYQTQNSDADQKLGPKNGLVVDRGVTRPIYWDFYMQSQAPIQGSARPAHYIVIHDEIFTSNNSDPSPADSLQQLTHDICYMMGRCTRSVGYATPAFLADKYCDRARRFMRAFLYYVEIFKKSGDHANPEKYALANANANNTMAYI